MDKAEYLSDNVELYKYYSEDYMKFEGLVCGYEFRVRFTEKGKLYFFTDNGVTCYNLSEDDFQSFNSIVQLSK